MNFEKCAYTIVHRRFCKIGSHNYVDFAAIAILMKPENLE